jgi:succinoglycan biosynthesis transport protein ExoP
MEQLPLLADANRSSEKRKNPVVPQAPGKGLSAAARLSGVTALALLKALRHHWMLAICLALAMGVPIAAAVWVFLPPPKPSAAAKLIMDMDPERVLYQHPEAAVNFLNYQATQIALLKSRLVLNAALRDPKVAALPIVRNSPDPVQWLEREIRVEPTNSLEIVRITLSGDNGQEVKTIVDAVVAAYLNEVVDKQKKRRRDRLDELKRLCTYYEDEAKRARERRQALGDVHDPKTESSLAAKFLEQEHAALWASLVNLEGQIRQLEVEEKTYDSRLAGRRLAPASMTDDYEQQAKQLEFLLSLRKQQEEALDITRKRVVDKKDKAVVELEGKIAELDSRIEEVRGKLRELTEGRIQNDRKSLLKYIDDLKALKKDKAEELGRLDAKVPVLNRKLLVADEARVNVDRMEKQLDHVLGEKDKLTVEFEDPTRVRLMEEATVSMGDNSPMRRASIAGGSGFGIVALVLLIVAFCEFRIHRVRAPEQVVDGVGVRLIGTVPAPPKRTPMPFTSGARTQNLYHAGLTEAVDSVRTLLMHEARLDSFRVLLVTSAVSGEGKTSLSAHLAVSLARTGRRTLLLDSDIRCPSCHTLFNMPLGPGFCEVLRGQAGLDEVIRPTSAANLFLLSAGQRDRQAVEALGLDQTGQWFERIRERFDFVIIDSCPVLPVNDALLLGQHSDAVLFSVMQGVSRLPQVQAAVQKISVCGGRILGAVVNGTVATVLGYGSRYLESAPPPAPPAS